MLTRRLSCLALLMALASPAMAANASTYGEKLEGFDYGWLVKHFTFTDLGDLSLFQAQQGDVK